MEKTINRTIMETSLKVTAVNAKNREFFERSYIAHDIGEAELEKSAKEMLAISDPGSILISVEEVSVKSVKFSMKLSEFIANAQRV